MIREGEFIVIKGKRIFITGGAGFIGSKLTELSSEFNELMLFDSLRRNSIKDTKLLDKKKVSLVQGDIVNYQQLKNAIDEFKPDIVIHMAAIAGVDNVINNPVLTMEVNMIGTYNVLCAIKPHISHIERFINFSTSEVFGSYAFKVDEQCPTHLAPVGEARWTYSASKLAGEHLTHSYYKQFGLPTVNVRPFNIYGPGQVGEGAIHTFIAQAIANEEIQIFGDGDQIRSWCYIDDFVEGIMLCLERDEALGNAFNIGNPRGTVTINQLADLIVLLSNSNSKIIHVPENYVDVELRIPSIEKAKKLLKFEPKVDIKEGIMKTIKWYQSLV